MTKVSSIGRGNYCLIFFLIAKSSLIIIQWLSGKSYDCRVFLFDLTLEQEMLFGSIGFDLPSGELPTLLYRSVPAACQFMSDA